jgi:hypothetical protein
MKTIALLILLGFTGCTRSPSLEDEFRACFEIERAAGTTEPVDVRLKELIPIGTDAHRYSDLFSIADETRETNVTKNYVFDNRTGARVSQGLVITIVVDKKTETIKNVVAAIAAM